MAAFCNADRPAQFESLPSMTTKALFGYATRWDQTTQLHCGTYKRLAPGAFDKSLASGSRIDFSINHIDGQCVGSNRDGLQLHSDEYGLAYRFRIPETPFGRQLRMMAESKEDDGISVGFYWHSAKKATRWIDGREVICIREAELYEVSLMSGLASGAIKDAFATYGNVDYSMSLREECLTGKYRYDAAAVGVTRALHRLLA